MEPTVDLETVKTFATGLSPWAHMATVGADGAALPVNSVRALNGARQPNARSL